VDLEAVVNDAIYGSMKELASPPMCNILSPNCRRKIQICIDRWIWLGLMEIDSESKLMMSSSLST